MVRTPCCEKMLVRKGPWSKEEDQILINYIRANGHANWRSLPKDAGLPRCGKSCRLRWMNYLRPDIKRGRFTREEEATIVKLHETIGNKWAKIAARLPGRTDNEIKNVWNTRLRKRLHEFAARPADDNQVTDNTLGIPEKDNPPLGVPENVLGIPENGVNFVAAAQNEPATNVEPHLSSSTATANNNNGSERLLTESDFPELDNVYRFWTQVNDMVGPDNHKSSGFDFDEYIPVVNEVGGPSSGTQFLQDNLSWINDELLLDNIWNY